MSEFTVYTQFDKKLCGKPQNHMFDEDFLCEQNTHYCEDNYGEELRCCNDSCPYLIEECADDNLFLEDIKDLKNQLDAINRLDLTKIRLYSEGQKVEIDSDFLKVNDHLSNFEILCKGGYSWEALKHSGIEDDS